MYLKSALTDGTHPIQALLRGPLSKEEEQVIRDKLQGKMASLALVNALIRTSMARL
jgi:hypothetical protein